MLIIDHALIVFNMHNATLRLPTDGRIEKTRKALKINNINTVLAKDSDEVKIILEKLLPENAEVMTATSTTLDQLGLTGFINEGKTYDSVKQKLSKLTREKDHLLMQKIGSAPEYVIGSVHAVTEDGKILVASGSGSQLPAYAYGASYVIWIVSTKKIVRNVEEGIKRIYNNVLPLEDARMKNVYGPQSGSNVNKLLILNKELNPDRITLIFVNENLGF